MLRFIASIISIFLIFLLSMRIPDDSAGLASFSARSDSAGFSLSSANRFLNTLTLILVVIYFGIAFLLNLSLR